MTHVTSSAAPIAAGIAIGLAYTLSPATVLSLLAIAGVIHWTARGIGGDERRWLLALLLTATAARLAAILALFLATNFEVVALRTFFGDEEFFLMRSVWLRNFAAGIPIHFADFLYIFDDTRRSSFTYLLALVQFLVGPSPYGAHVISVACFLAACGVLYRLVRQSFGAVPALTGLALLLFLPSLFAWSIAVLKEPIYVLVLVLGLAAAVASVRADGWWHRCAGLVLLAMSGVAAQSLRAGGLLMVGFGGVVGLAIAIAWRRPRLAVVFGAVCAAGLAVLLSSGTALDRLVFVIRHAAAAHWENVNTPGYAYPILDASFYADRNAPDRMTFEQGVAFIGGAFAKYVMVPEPWNTKSRAALAYIPEQVVWYGLVLMLPAGLVAAFRRDPVLAALLSAYAAAAGAIVALNSGNVGTLVRHRGLALPFLLWLSVLGACELTRVLARGREVHAVHR